MRQATVSLGEDAQIPFTVVLGDTVVAATAGPTVSEVFVNGAHDAAQTAAATVTQLADAGGTPIDGAYFVELDTDALTVLDSVIVKVTATPTGGSPADGYFSVNFVDPAAAAGASRIV